ncbi:hypothetical protein J6590_019023 [Homalodisca vitripennis]|nr:hypothetical protein J6590_019023 [Homalodisca vitripennis]
MNTDGNTPYPQNLTFKFGESVAVGQFSSIHQEVMASLREQTRGDFCCSTCSSCDTCSTDTWSRTYRIALDDRYSRTLEIQQSQRRPNIAAYTLIQKQTRTTHINLERYGFNNRAGL